MALAGTMVGCLAAVAPASAGVGFGVAPDFPNVVTAGNTNVPGALVITNASDGTEADDPIQLDEIRLNPSCASGFPCTQPDFAVFGLSATGTGSAGTACAGETFTIGPPGANGDRPFTPTPGPVTLAPPNLSTDTDTCRIGFTFDVLKVPTFDTQPAVPGVQTRQIAVAAGHSLVNSLPGSGFGSDVTTVNGGSPTISTSATSATLGGQIHDTATLSGGVNPAGTVTFKAFSDSGCTTQVFTSTNPVNASGVATSDPFTPTAAGSYFWTADYSGDNNNNPASSPCGAANETSTVTAPPPPPKCPAVSPTGPLSRLVYSLGQRAGPLGAALKSLACSLESAGL